MKFRAPVLYLVWFVMLAGAHSVPAQLIDTVAGNVSGLEGPPARQIPLVLPRAVAVDPAGVYLYIADDGSRTVRKVHLITGETTIVAGGGAIADDLTPVPGKSASLNLPFSLALDSSGNLYISDNTQFRIRRLSPGGLITTVVGNGTPGFSGDDGPALRAQLGLVGGVVVDLSGNLFIADRGNRAVRKVNRQSGTITTIAGGPNASATGNGIAAVTARLVDPYGIALDAIGNVYVADSGDQTVRKVDAATGLIQTVAGVSGSIGTSGDNGPATAALLSDPRGVAVAPNGDVYIGMSGRIRKVTAATGIISRILGGGNSILAEGIVGTNVLLTSNAEQLAVMAGSNTLYAALSGDNFIGSVNLNSGIFNVVAGTALLLGDGGPALTAALAQPEKLAVGPDGTLYIADMFHHMIRRVSPGAGGVGTGTIFPAAGTGDPAGGDPNGQPATGARIAFPRAVFADATNTVYFSHNQRLIYRIAANGTLQKVAGTTTQGFNTDGVSATLAQLNDPRAIVKDVAGNIYIADAGNHRIRKIDQNGTITTVAGTAVPGSSGDDGPGTSAQLNTPVDLLIDSQGRLLIADSDPAARAGRVRQLDLSSGIITTIYSGIEVRALAQAGNGDLLLGGVSWLLRLNRNTAAVTTVAGNGVVGFSGDGGLASLARVGALRGLVVDAVGNILLTDVTFCRIRRVSSTLVIPNLLVNPGMLTFGAHGGGASPRAQSLQVSTSNLVPASWSASVLMQNGAGWLSISQSSGVTPAVVQVAVDSSSLPAGSYNGAVTITAPGATNSPSTVTIHLDVTSGDPPRLQVTPRFLSFRATQGGTDAPSQSLEIINTGGGALTWSANVLTSSGGDWLTISPEGGSGGATVSLMASVGSLSSGLYQALLSFVSNGGTAVVSVVLQVEAPIPSLLLSQTSVVFVTKEGSSFIPPQTIRVLNAGEGNLNWQAEPFLLSGGSWLALSSKSGSTAAGSATAVTLSASLGGSAAGLSQGVYDTLLLVNAPGAVNSPQFLLARLLVEDKNSAPTGILQPGGLVLVGSAGGSIVQSDPPVSLYNTGDSSTGTSLNFVAAPSTENGIPWLQVSPATGSLLGSADRKDLAVQANPALLTAGGYRGQIAVSYSTGITEEVGVLFVVVPPGTLISPLSEGLFLQRSLPTATVCAASSLHVEATSISNGLSLPLSFTRPVLAQVVNNCGVAVYDATVVANIEGRNIHLDAVGGGQYSGNWTPTQVSSAILVTLSATHPTLGSVQRNYTVSTTAALGGLNLPVVAPDGVVEGAGFTPLRPLAPGSIVSIFGTGFASSESFANVVPLERSLGGTSVRIGGEEAPLYYVGPGQINAQVPFTANAGERVSIVVNVNGRPTAPQSYLIAPTQPGIFNGAVLDFQNNPAAGGLPVTPANPARLGHDLIIYSNGLGKVEQEVDTGQASPAARVLLPVTVTIGGVEVPVPYAGLTPGYVGLYQVNVTLTNNVPTGDNIPVILKQNGIESNPNLPILLSIR